MKQYTLLSPVASLAKLSGGETTLCLTRIRIMIQMTARPARTHPMTMPEAVIPPYAGRMGSWHSSCAYEKMNEIRKFVGTMVRRRKAYRQASTLRPVGYTYERVAAHIASIANERRGCIRRGSTIRNKFILLVFEILQHLYATVVSCQPVSVQMKERKILQLIHLLGQLGETIITKPQIL